MVEPEFVTTPQKLKQLDEKVSDTTLYNGVFSATFLFCVTPMYVLNLQSVKANSHHIGFVLMTCSDVSMYFRVLLTINRFCAVFLPITYRIMFDSKFTKFIILITSLLSFSVITTFFKILPCKISYNPDNWTFTYNYFPICITFAQYDSLKVALLAIFNVVMDLITIAKLRKTKKLTSNRNLQSAVSNKEIDFLKQTFSQSLYVFIAMPTSIVIRILTSDKMIIFVISNVFWCLLFALDGVFTLKFNSEVRKALQRAVSSNVVTINE